MKAASFSWGDVQIITDGAIPAVPLRLMNGWRTAREGNYIYPNGDEVSNVEIIYLCRKYHGEIVPQKEEMEELKFFSPKEIDLGEVSPPIRPVLERYLELYLKGSI